MIIIADQTSYYSSFIKNILYKIIVIITIKSEKLPIFYIYRAIGNFFFNSKFFFKFSMQAEQCVELPWCSNVIVKCKTVLYFWNTALDYLECSETQPKSSQMFYAGRKCKRGCVDSGWARVLQTPSPAASGAHVWVCLCC